MQKATSATFRCPSLLWLCLSSPVLCCAALNDLFLGCWPVPHWEGVFAPQLCRNALYSEGCLIQAEIKVQSLKVTFSNPEDTAYHSQPSICIFLHLQKLNIIQNVLGWVKLGWVMQKNSFLFCRYCSPLAMIPAQSCDFRLI